MSAVDHLRQELRRRSEKDPSYSIRTFAKALGIHSSTLAALLNGTRPLSAKTAKRLLERLGLDPLTKERLISSSLGMHPEEAASEKFHVLEDWAVKLVGSWEHFAIASLLETHDADASSLGWIASKLGISPQLALEALFRLEKAGMVRREGAIWKATGASTTTTTDIPSEVLRGVHRQHIEKSLEALERDPIEHRDMTGVTMAISRKKLPMAKQMIREFSMKLCQFLEADEKDEVFRLNIQLFSLEQPAARGGEKPRADGKPSDERKPA